MFNKVILIGHLTRDIEIRYLSSGTALAKCAIATNRRYKDSLGNQKDETMLELFSQNGFHKTTIPDIAKKLKMSVGNLYNYFSSKLAKEIIFV